MTSSIVNQYGYFTANGEDVFVVRTLTHGHCVRWLSRLSGKPLCFRLVPGIDVSDELIEVFAYLILTRLDTTIQHNRFAEQNITIYNNPLPEHLHQIVLKHLQY